MKHIQIKGLTNLNKWAYGKPSIMLMT
uniref:Uncharacterized protein n=1 Tax=Rhizophora mucronata TaxID=61149 RepID=A0A2P2NRK1_RHIMU